MLDFGTRVLVGTTDLKRQFHPFGIMLTRDENTQDYAHMFSCVKDLAMKISAYSYNPTVLVADFAPAKMDIIAQINAKKIGFLVYLFIKFLFKNYLYKIIN